MTQSVKGGCSRSRRGMWMTWLKMKKRAPKRNRFHETAKRFTMRYPRRMGAAVSRAITMPKVRMTAGLMGTVSNRVVKNVAGIAGKFL